VDYAQPGESGRGWTSVRIADNPDGASPNFPGTRLVARYGLPTLYEWRVKPTGILVTYDGLSNIASPVGLPAALGRE
jgi:hypothetical protein